jgi:hypothetical protein
MEHRLQEFAGFIGAPGLVIQRRQRPPRAHVVRKGAQLLHEVILGLCRPLEAHERIAGVVMQVGERLRARLVDLGDGRLERPQRFFELVGVVEDPPFDERRCGKGGLRLAGERGVFASRDRIPAPERDPGEQLVGGTARGPVVGRRRKGELRLAGRFVEPPQPEQRPRRRQMIVSVTGPQRRGAAIGVNGAIQSSGRCREIAELPPHGGDARVAAHHAIQELDRV